MRILVIGGGWYGCHLALALVHAGFEVTLAEAEARLFARASGHNQNRLHLGLHYPRSHRTRTQALYGYHHFLSAYPGLSSEVPHNIYAVAAEGSLVDLGTFLQVCEASGIDTVPVDPESVGLRNVEGAVACSERLILTDLAREYFRRTLYRHAQTGYAVHHIAKLKNRLAVDGQTYDWVINTTSFAFRAPRNPSHWFEPTVLFIYRTVEPFVGRTIMDGDFVSIFPYQDRAVSLSSVPLSPQGQFATYAEARNRLDSLTASDLTALRRRMEAQARVFCPAFDDLYSPVGVQLSIKTKMLDAAAARLCMVLQEGREIHVFPGKIDAIFTAEDAVFDILESDGDVGAQDGADDVAAAVYGLAHRPAADVASAHRLQTARRMRLEGWRSAAG